VLLLLPALLALQAQDPAPAERPPNVLFVVIDDLNDRAGCLGGPEGLTPALDALAARSTLFTNAHAPAPACGPSRASVLLGRLPHRTGVYANVHVWQLAAPEAVPLPRRFREEGWHTAGAGKVFHSAPGCNDPASWDEYFFWVPSAPRHGWSEPLNQPPLPFPPDPPLQRIPGLQSEGFDWGPITVPDAEMPDARMAAWAEDFLRRPHPEPFFLAVGFVTPHLPWYVRRPWLERFPREEIRLPEVPPGDLEDLPAEALHALRRRRREHRALVEAGAWASAIQAYQASTAFQDAALGRVLRALEESGEDQRTLIVVWSDHGYHLGEKEIWHKRTLWERSSRVPLVVRLPGQTEGRRCSRPVSLVDLYPTLLDLAGLEPDPEHDGRSLRPLLEDPEAPWDGVALVETARGLAVRDERWRWIRHPEGGEELYDLEHDPGEFHNLAASEDPEARAARERLRTRAPESVAPPAPRRGDCELIQEGRTYRWVLRPPEEEQPGEDAVEDGGRARAADQEPETGARRAARRKAAYS